MSKPYSDFSLEGHLGASSDAYKKFRETHTIKTPEVGEHVDPQYAGGSELKLKGPDQYRAAQEAIEAEALAKKMPDYKTSEADKAKLETQGEVVHTHLDRTERTLAEARTDLGKHVDDIKADITARVKSKELTVDEGKAAHDLVDRHAKEVEADFKSVEETVKAHRADVETHTGVKSKAKEYKAPAGSAAAAAGSAAKKHIGAHTEYSFDKLKMHERMGAATKASWEHSGNWGKGARVIGTGAGVLLVGKGVKDLFADIGGGRADEKGDKIPSGAGDIVADVIKLGAGAGIVHGSLVAGGRGHAIG